MEHGLLEDAKAQEKAYKAFLKRKTAPNTKSTIASNSSRRYLDVVNANTLEKNKNNNDNSASSDANVKDASKTPTRLESVEKKKSIVKDDDSSDDDVPLAQLVKSSW